VTPSRDALVERWLRASHAHPVTRLNSGPSTAPPPPDLAALAQREFAIAGRYRLTAAPARAAGEPWWERAWDWIVQGWQKLWNLLFAHAHVGKATAASIGDVLLVIVGILLIYVVVRLLRNLQLSRTPAPAESEALPVPPAPFALYKEACAAAARGEYGAAALLLFGAMVAVLDRQGMVGFTTSSTVGDLRRTLRARNAAMVGSFDAVAAPFVQKAYAERPIDESQWQRARQAYVILSGE
jgi:hypothetical protein